jgi:hypothetical protein
MREAFTAAKTTRVIRGEMLERRAATARPRTLLG